MRERLTGDYRATPSSLGVFKCPRLRFALLRRGVTVFHPRTACLVRCFAPGSSAGSLLVVRGASRGSSPRQAVSGESGVGRPRGPALVSLSAPGGPLGCSCRRAQCPLYNSKITELQPKRCRAYKNFSPIYRVVILPGFPWVLRSSKALACVVEEWRGGENVDRSLSTTMSNAHANNTQAFASPRTMASNKSRPSCNDFNMSSSYVPLVTRSYMTTLP